MHAVANCHKMAAHKRFSLLLATGMLITGAPEAAEPTSHY